MRLHLIAGVGLLLLTGAAVSHPAMESDAAARATLDHLASIATRNLHQILHSASRSSPRASTCTKSNTAIRREWGVLSSEERIAYTNAVLCFQNKTTLTPAELVPGARSRFDDFVATHMNQTNSVHYTGTFLAWHRYFIWAYEQALRDECGYAGTQPYWDWSKFSNATTSGPVFDGSATSMSGNGIYVAGRGEVVLTLPGYDDIRLPPGNGGGCVLAGPFKDMTVNLGPVALALNNGSFASNGDGFAYNPRCLQRDIGHAVNDRYGNATSFARLLSDSQDIETFQTTLQGIPGSGEIGVHGGGHWTIAGDPGGDTFTAPGDPAFYLLHAMIDRTWWIWQMQDPENRLNAISGTSTFLNTPKSADTTLETVIDLGFAGNDVYAPTAMSDLMSTTAGPFCYTYDSL
ncbi:putative tyrosinase central domain protein [Diplocarpon rosae]|nr:putative tyrosinase central domain protein [Diplocarpon rosae]